jgi:hypothetical protein
MRHRTSTPALPRGQKRAFTYWLPEWCAWLLYVSMAASAIVHHEPWADEAQAWQISRTTSLKAILGTYLHYEGAPGLWHLLLWLMHKCHVSYGGLHWICGVIASAGIAFLLIRAPFPRPIKLLLPFTYFLSFQFAVIARPYMLFPILIFAVASNWNSIPRRPIRVAILLGLLATVSLHTAAISLGFAIVYAVELWRDHTQRGTPAVPTGQLVASSAVLVAFFLGAAFVAAPAPDVWIASMPASQVQLQVTPSGGSAPTAVGRRTHALQWNTRIVALRTLSSLGWGTIQPILLGLPFWLLIAAAFAQRRRLLYLLPVGTCVAFSALAYVNFWHAGLLVPCLIALYWIIWRPREAGASPGRLIRWTYAAIIYAVLVQCAWTAHALFYDFAHAYAPDEETARFLFPYVTQKIPIVVASFQENGIGAFKSVGILPYFDHNIYINERLPFWLWSTRNDVGASFPSALQHHPGIILLEYTGGLPYSSRMDGESAHVALSLAAGYQHTHTFCGAMPEAMGFGEYTCHLVFQPAR